MHIGILATDRVRDELLPEHGDYPDMFEAVFRHVEPNLEFSTFDVCDAVPDAVDCDAYLITGSRYSVYDELPWIPPLVEFIRAAMAAGRKIVGICFGHQLMAHYFGGHVGPAPVGWAVGVHTSRVEPQPWMRTIRSEVSLLSSHKDQVQTLPSGARLYAANGVCPIAGFTLGNQVITVQGHPEFDKAYAQALMTLRRDVLGEALVETGLASLQAETDSALMVRWVLDFLEQGDT